MRRPRPLHALGAKVSKLVDRLLAKAKTAGATPSPGTGAFAGIVKKPSSGDFFQDFDEVESFEAVCLRETDAALLCRVQIPCGEDEEHWFPKSQVDESSEVKAYLDEGTLVVSRWIAVQKELA